MFNFDILHDAK